MDPNSPATEATKCVQALVSFDADGTGYTADELGDMLDVRVDAMRRGEGVLTLEEFIAKGEAFWASSE